MSETPATPSISELSDKLFPKGHAHRCTDAACKESIVEIRGRHFITFGHAGFNSPANNGNGYETRARAAIRYYSSRRRQ